MAYDPTVAALTLIQDGFASGMPRVFYYPSTHASSQITATGFFAAAGDGGRSANNVGLRLGDVVMCRASTSSTRPGAVVWGSVIGSTANVASTSASSAFLSSMGYDCTLAISS